MNRTVNKPKKLVGKERIVIDLLETEDVNNTKIERRVVTKVNFEWLSEVCVNLGEFYGIFIVDDNTMSFDELKVGEYYVFEYFYIVMNYNYISLIGKTDIICDKEVLHG